MPIHHFGHSNQQYIRQALHLGGQFWERFSGLPLEAGTSFAFLPAGCPAELGARLKEAVLGDFEDLSGFREEEAFVLRHVRGHDGNLVLFGMNRSDALLAKNRCLFEVCRVHSLPDSYYSRGLLLHGRTVAMEDVRNAISLAECPFVMATLLETGADDPVEWIEARLGESDFERILAATVALMVEAYRGDGILFWTRERNVIRDSNVRS
jgi:hypothetical protein